MLHEKKIIPDRGISPRIVIGETKPETMLFRNHLALILLALAATPASAQQPETPPMRTLLGGEKDLANGGWGAPTAHYTRILDHDALLVGARGGWLINHRFTLGLAAQGLVTNVPNTAYDRHLMDEGYRLRRPNSLYLGYGGLLLEPVIAYRSPIHIALPIMIGAGGATYGYEHGYASADSLPHGPHTDHGEWDAQAFFVVEPGIELEINMIRLLRVGLGVSYRWTSDLDLPATPKDALHGLNAGVSIKVGCF
jgi:hypothetical protein